MLKVLSNSAPDGIDKSLGLAQVLAKEDIESLLANRDISLVLYLTLVLLPSEQGSIFQEGSRKRNLVRDHGSNGGKVIFALVEEIVTLQVSFTPINVREPSFRRPLMWAFIVRSGGNDGGRNGCWRFKIQNGLEDLLEFILQVSNYRGIGRAGSSKRSDDTCKSGSRSTCRGVSKGATFVTLGGSSAIKLVFAVVRILASTAMSKGLSHWTGWVGTSKKNF